MSRDIGSHLLGHQESVDVDPVQCKIGTTPHHYSCQTAQLAVIAPWGFIFGHWNL